MSNVAVTVPPGSRVFLQTAATQLNDAPSHPALSATGKNAAGQTFPFFSTAPDGGRPDGIFINNDQATNAAFNSGDVAVTITVKGHAPVGADRVDTAVVTLQADQRTLKTFAVVGADPVEVIPV